jgi:deoxyribodipyrimidine photolyase-related protein
MPQLRQGFQLAQTLARQLGAGALLLRTLSAKQRKPSLSCHQLILILGDQLDRESAALAACDRKRDRILMIEARNESERVPSHQARTALFLAAMRHHADWLEQQGFALDYVRIGQPDAASFDSALRAAIERNQPQSVSMVEAGEYGVQEEIVRACAAASVPLELHNDTHFLCSREAFDSWRKGRKTLVMEHFYRHMRKTHGILMQDGKPLGGKWNFDQKNRSTFGRQGPGMVPPPPRFDPDRITTEVTDEVEQLFPNNPGSLDNFAWPVTREQALEMLDDFIGQRLAAFGPYQDAMWQGQTLLYHSGISAALNLKLLNPREVISAAIAAHEQHQVPMQSVEGFVRQILGWREFVRGVYWTEMPGYLDKNALDATLPLPHFYWDGDTDMSCLHSVIGQTLETGYAHHIQRLMVTGLFALLLGVRPREVHEWYLAIYIDAVEWVEAPNTLGMSQYADGGLLASKPYAASGRYIQRMSNYCAGCRYAPDQSTGDSACPFTTLYWDFLLRHEARFANHPRAAMQWRMLQRLDQEKRAEIRAQADRLRADIGDQSDK